VRERERKIEREGVREKNVFICIVGEHGVNTMKMNEPTERGAMQLSEITKMPLDLILPCALSHRMLHGCAEICGEW